MQDDEEVQVVRKKDERRAPPFDLELEISKAVDVTKHHPSLRRYRRNELACEPTMQPSVQ
jgi:hypothetical protein